MAIKIIALWLVCGSLAYLIEINTPKMIGEEPVSYGRCLVFGPIMLLALIFTLCLWGPPDGD